MAKRKGRCLRRVLSLVAFALSPLAMATSLIQTSPPGQDKAVLSGVVLRVDHPAAGSGYAWVMARYIVAEDGSWKEVSLYDTYLDESATPPVGRHCHFRFHTGISPGIIADLPDYQHKVVNLIDTYTCDAA